MTEKHYQKEIKNDFAKLFSQTQLNDLTRDLNLLKEAAQILGSRLKEKNVLKRFLKAKKLLYSTVTERKSFYAKKILCYTGRFWFIVLMCKA